MPMANREFLMLSQTLNLAEARSYSLGNWFVSEKLDGMRAIWLPDTIGIPVGNLPFANLDKSGNPKKPASGLWSRYAKPIWAPSWWLETFPRNIFLDGELWCGRKRFQELTSIVKRHDPDDRWKDVEFRVFDSPSPDYIYSDGKIHNGTFKKNFRGVFEWCKKNLPFEYIAHGDTFEKVYYKTLLPLPNGSCLKIHQQVQLTWNNQGAVESLTKLLGQVLETGGEGLIVRHPQSTWVPRRMNTVLKVKPELENDAVITGFSMGEGRLVGLIGALEVEGEIADANGKSRRVAFKLGTGLSDSERAFPSTIFRVGTVITYRYRELTEDGIPREGAFLRVRSDF
jgi:DNA ligase-1